jgi:uncharacterized protein YjbI with pentapeptide repeats
MPGTDAHQPSRVSKWVKRACGWIKHRLRGLIPDIGDVPLRDAVATVLWRLVLIVVIATGVAVGITFGSDHPSLSSALNVEKLALAVVAGAAAAVGLVVTYRRQLTLEQGDLKDRFERAAGQLGHGSAAVRLAGVVAMARLADEWADERQMCVGVLCAYLRVSSRTAGGEDVGEPEVRQTIVRSIAERLRADARVSWSGCDLDFTGVTFDGADFSDVRFTGGRVSFDSATFPGGKVSFDRASFSGGKVSFDESRFSGASVWFSVAKFSGGLVTFNDADFSGGSVMFGAAKFSGASVWFDRATFSKGQVAFDVATFSKGQVSCGDARFSGGQVSFAGARFSGGTVDLSRPTDWTRPPVGLPEGGADGVLLPPDQLLDGIPPHAPKVC